MLKNEENNEAIEIKSSQDTKEGLEIKQKEDAKAQPTKEEEFILKFNKHINNKKEHDFNKKMFEHYYDTYVYKINNDEEFDCKTEERILNRYIKSSNSVDNRLFTLIMLFLTVTINMGISYMIKKDVDVLIVVGFIALIVAIIELFMFAIVKSDNECWASIALEALIKAKNDN